MLSIVIWVKARIDVDNCTKQTYTIIYIGEDDCKLGNNLKGTKRRIPKQDRSIQNRDKILDAGLKLFSEKGYYDTTTNEIAKVAGVSIGSLYSYFKDKDAIFLNILDKYHRRFLSFFTKLMRIWAMNYMRMILGNG